MTWCTYTKSQMPYLNITVFWCCGNFLNLNQQILHVDFVEPINWLGLYLSYNWFMQSLKLVPATFLYYQIFRRKVGLIYFFNCFLAAPQPTLGYYRGENPHQPDFDPKFNGGLVTSFSCFKAPGELQVKIVENVVIAIRSVRLFLWKWPRFGRGQPNNSSKKPSWVPSGVWTKNHPILIVMF